MGSLPITAISPFSSHDSQGERAVRANHVDQWSPQTRQRCVGEVIDTSKFRLSIGLLIAVIGSWQITALPPFLNHGSHDVRDIGVNRFLLRLP